jgi:hypothetical protein
MFVTMKATVLGVAWAPAAGEKQKHEKFLFATRTGPYQDQARFQLLVERVEALISKEATTWAQVSKQPVKETHAG